MKRLLSFLMVVITISCNPKKESQDDESREDIRQWQIYVSPKSYGVSYGSGAYEVYRCKYCNPKESMDEVVNQEIKNLENKLNQKNKRSVKESQTLQKQLDSLKWEREIISQAIVDFIHRGY